MKKALTGVPCRVEMLYSDSMDARVMVEGKVSQMRDMSTEELLRTVAVVAVEVNSDISSGDCPEGTPTMKDGPQDITCAEPADRIFRALAEALGKPAPSPPAQ